LEENFEFDFYLEVLVARSRIFINKEFQVKVATYVTSLVLLFLFIYPLIIYKVFDFVTDFLSADCQVDSLAQLNQSRSQILIILIIVQLMFLAVIFIGNIYLSHRIAGPLHKLVNSMKQGFNGALPKSLHFRKNDYFPEVAEEYTKLLESIHQKLSLIESDINKAAQSGDMNAAKVDLNKALEKIAQF
jgi:sensor histidine kinase YesM